MVQILSKTDSYDGTLATCNNNGGSWDVVVCVKMVLEG